MEHSMLSVALITKRPDSELFRAILAREPDALAELYDQYSSLAYSILLRITRDRSASEDIMQEAFFRVWIRIQDFNPTRGSLSQWLIAIARNLAIDHIRLIRVRSKMQLYAFYESEAAAAPARPKAAELEDRDIISKTFPRLTASHRQLLQMAYFDGCSQSEIAQRLQMPLGTIKSRMRSALQEIRNALQSVSVPRALQAAEKSQPCL